MNRRLVIIIFLWGIFFWFLPVFSQQDDWEKQSKIIEEILSRGDIDILGAEEKIKEALKKFEEPEAVPYLSSSGIKSQEVDPFSGEKIFFEAKGADIVDVLKLIAEKGNINLVISKNVRGRISVFLKDVNPWEALEIVLLSNDLAYEKKGEIVKVMTAQEYEHLYGRPFLESKRVETLKLKYARASRLAAVLNQIKTGRGRIIADDLSNTLVIFDVPSRLEKMKGVVFKMDRPLQTKIFKLNYAKAEDLGKTLKGSLTKDVGIVEVDNRSNTLAVTDYPEKIERIEKVVKAFDEKTLQVLIEAEIIEITLNDSYQAGIDWQYIIEKNTNLRAFNIDRTFDTKGSRVIIGKVNNPEEKGDYKFILNMLRTFGKTQVLSKPRIAALSGEEATILVGSKKVYISSSTVYGETGGVTTVSENINFVDVGIKLKVVPVVNPRGFITMQIKPEISSKSEDFVKSDGTTIPIIDTSEVETSVMVKDGVTIVLGGLMKKDLTDKTYKVPFLGEIPGVGKLFQRKEKEVINKELVIFITPHIISGEENAFSELKRIPQELK